MKLKFCSILTLAFLCITISVFAQQGRNLDDHVLIKMSQQSIYQPVPEKYEGSPYMNEEFVEGDVYVNEGKYNALPLRYNIFKDYVEFKKGGQIYILDASLKINKISIGSDTLVVHKYIGGRAKEVLGYFKLLENGKATLLVKQVVKYREAQPPKALETEGKLAKYSVYPDMFYLKFNDGELIEVNNVKKLPSSFPDQQDKVEAFLKENKISRNEEDLKKLISYYNAL